MPLTRGRILGYDSQRMVFAFSMLEGYDHIECQISAAAIDVLVGGPRGHHADREAQFAKLRETIEGITSNKFDIGTMVRGSILRIFAKDIPKAMLRDDLSPLLVSPSPSHPEELTARS
jgi:hypothetical protein